MRTKMRNFKFAGVAVEHVFMSTDITGAIAGGLKFVQMRQVEDAMLTNALFFAESALLIMIKRLVEEAQSDAQTCACHDNSLFK